MNVTNTLQPGDLAWMDTLRSGLVPVKIIEDNAPLPTFKVMVTATRPAYPCGRVLNRRKTQVIPR